MKTNKTVSLILAAVFIFTSCISLAACKKDPSDETVHILPGTSADASMPPASQAPVTTPETEITPVPDTQAPAETDTPVSTDAPSNPPSGFVSMGTEDMPARFTMPTDLYGLSQAECENWFSDAVFVGDSITLGWKNFNSKMLEKNPDFFGQTHFFCEGSYGTGHALEPISENSLHPIYGGEQHYIWDAVALMKAKKVFILFGLNDIAIYGVQGTADNFAELISRIRQESPDAEIYIISAMYMYKGSEKKKLNNKNIYALNKKLAAYCNENDAEFINIASHLIDENGFVPDEYSSDKYVHQTYKAYEVWAEILRSVAARHILGMGRICFN